MDLSRIKAVVWDFDGVWYDYDALPNNGFYDLCDHSAAIAGCQLVASLDYDTSLKAARKSYEEYHDGISGHIPFLMNEGMSEHDARVAIFEAYHSSLFLRVQEQHTQMLSPCHQTLSTLETLQPHIKQTVLTHASRDHWVIPFLNAIGKSHYFDQKEIIDYQDFGFQPKGSSPEGIIMAVEALELDPSEIVFVEDSLVNLQVAKEQYPNITTALKTDKPEVYDGADIVIRRPLDILQQIEASITPNATPTTQHHLKL